MKLDLKTLLHIFFTTIIFCSTAGLQAKTLYWVGGSGTWGDFNHWSSTSGGSGGNENPGIDDDAIFDKNSGLSDGAVSIYSNIAVNNFTVKDKLKVSFVSSSNDVLIFNKKVDFGSVQNNQIKGEVHLLNHHLSQGYKKYSAGTFQGFLSNNGKPAGDDIQEVTAVTFNTIDQTCPSNAVQDGSSKVTPLDGVGPFEYNWVLQGSCTQAQNTTTDSATNLCGGAQSVLITDVGDGGSVTFFSTFVGPPEMAVVINNGDITHVSCPGAADGAVPARVFGGTGPYTFAWDNGSTDSINSPVAAGDYVVTVTDANGCPAPSTATGTVNEPPPIVITPDAVEIPLCGGTGCTEDVTFTAAGGNGPPPGGFVISGINPVIAAPVNLVNICPGESFEVATEDASGCPQTLTHTATTPPTVTVTVVEDKPVTCLGVDDGEATASAAGGTGPYDFVWLNVPGAPITSATVTGLPAGTYQVEGTDQGTGCKDTGTVIITSPTPQVVIASISNSQDATCLTASNGSATASGAGGTPAYLFDWYNVPGGPSTPTVGTLPPGTYNVEVQDQDGCVDTAEVIITAPAVSPVTASASNTTVATCLTASNGEATAAGSGGTPGYLFDWYDVPGAPITTAVVANLPIGTYNVGVTDQDGCADTTQVIVTAPAVSPVTASATIDQIITCLTASNGAATASGSGGTPGYFFDWYDVPGAPITSASVSSLPIGTYNVGVTDQDGCADTTQVVITPAVVSPITATITSFRDVVCLGLPTGSATASASGGTPAYDFEWYNIIGKPTTPQVSNLNIGVYFVEVTDQDNCKDTASVTIAAPNPPVITTALNPVVQPDCDGVTCNGSATATASGGTNPYVYEWFDAPGSPVGQNIANLCFGTYNVAVVDSNGCTDTTELAFTPPMTISLDSKTDIICGGNCTGVINVAGSGGFGVFVYDWYDMTGTPTFNAANDSAFGVCAGTYHIEISDGTPTGCFDTLEVTIIEPTPMAISVDRQNNNLCFGDCNGEIDVSVTGGTLPVAALWTDSNGVAPVNPGIVNLSALCNGSYTYEARDNLNCVVTETVSITSPNTTVNFNLSPLCPDDVVANVQAIASGGTAPYDYRWLDPVTGSVTSNLQIGLSPGSYDLEVVDFNNCTDTFNITFAIPLPIASSSVITDALCQGVCNGAIDVTISGGTGSYLTEWYDMTGTPSTEDLTDVCAGGYNLAIQDANGCRDTLKSVVVNAITSIATSSAEIQATCDGLCDGKAWVTASNGTPNYIYNWYDAPSGNVVQDTAFNMCVGNYNVEITDQQNCVDTIVASVTAPVVVSTSFINVAQNLCAQDCNGTAEVVVNGGVGPIQIDWLNVPLNPITPAVSGLCNGSYRVEVEDANGCKDRDTVDITSQSGTMTFNTTNPSCGGYKDGSITAVPVGVPAIYTPTWYTITGKPKGLTVSGLAAGTYKLELTDANDCVDTFDVSLTDPFPAIDLQTDSQVISCFGVCDGKAWATPTGGEARFEYSWYSPGGNSIIDTAYNLCVGTYFVAVVDNNGCEDTASVTITEPFTVSLSSTSKPPCFGVCDGNATAVVSGEVRPFTYLWNDPSLTTDSALSDLCAGNYKVIVTNATGCVDSAEVTLDENTQISALLDSNQATCTNFTNGSASIIPIGGVQPYQYLWTNGEVYTSVVPNPNDLAIGKYYVVVSDSIGCTYQDSVSISEVYVVKPNAGSDAVICEGDSATLVGSGGTSYLWSTGDTSSTVKVSPTASATYTLTVKNNICTDDDKVTVTLHNKPTATVTADKDALLKGFNMSTTIRGEGAGDSGFYDWVPPTGLSDPTSPTPTVSPLVNTRYYLTVTDANGCVDTSSVLISIIESIEYPDGVSPNGDGLNDTWPIRFIDNFPECIVEIYNRWGQMLFHSVGYKERWDGTYNGKTLPVGTYYFVIDLGPDLPKYTGPITIFR